MTIASLANEIGLPPFENAITKGFPAEQENPIKAASSHLADLIRNDEVAAEDIDSFIDGTLSLLPKSKKSDVLEFLLAKKGMMLCEAGAIENGLRFYDEALEVKETPSTWALKGTGLLQIERLDDAFKAFQNAFELRNDFGPQKESYLNDLIVAWSASALLRGLYGILEQDISEATKGVEEYINVSSKSRAEGLDASLVALTAHETVSKDLKEAMEELGAMVRLLSIKNPFDRWREFSKEISAVWPKDVSAVDAIREQRG